MRIALSLALLAIATLGLTACQSNMTTGKAAESKATDFQVTLTASQEVPPVQSNATGHAYFSIAPDGKSISYRLYVKNINDVTMAHLHIGSAGENGPHVAWLYPTTGDAPRKIAGLYSGLLAKGHITANSLVEKLKGQSLATLIQDMRTGRVYVNIHSTEHPEGDIRGQLRPTGQD